MGTADQGNWHDDPRSLLSYASEVVSRIYSQAAAPYWVALAIALLLAAL